jgi:glycosyltransferase involved in cell wall biosynthesis
VKVSVCIVTYNHARYISDCLASVVAQQLNASMEILVGDDCSTDETREIVSTFCHQYPKLIKPIFHKKNIGASHNYQSLIERADGDFIAHLDGDDFWLPGKLAAQLEFLEKNAQCVAVYANAMVINDYGELIARFNGKLATEFTLDDLLKKGNFLNFSSVVYRANCKAKLLEMSVDAMDFQYNLILASQGKLGYVNKVLVAYRKNSST